MKRFAVVAAIVLLSTGCRAPMPNWNMFGPYGATRVPPPPTGGYGTPQPYYAPGTTTVAPTVTPSSAPVGTGFRPVTSNRWSNIVDPAVGPVAKNNSWEPTRSVASNAQVVDMRDADVALASYESTVPVAPATVIVEREGPIRILSSESSPSSTARTTVSPPRLRGMVVNDTTRASEPRPFVPTGRVVNISPSPGTSTTSRTASQANASVGGWKSR